MREQEIPARMTSETLRKSIFSTVSDIPQPADLPPEKIVRLDSYSNFFDLLRSLPAEEQKKRLATVSDILNLPPAVGEGLWRLSHLPWFSAHPRPQIGLLLENAGKLQKALGKAPSAVHITPNLNLAVEAYQANPLWVSFWEKPWDEDRSALSSTVRALVTGAVKQPSRTAISAHAHSTALADSQNLAVWPAGGQNLWDDGEKTVDLSDPVINHPVWQSIDIPVRDALRTSEAYIRKIIQNGHIEDNDPLQILIDIWETRVWPAGEHPRTKEFVTWVSSPASINPHRN